MVDPAPGIFRDCLDKYFSGATDRRTSAMVEAAEKDH
jgi:uncharacterized protein (DUF1810 family)